MSRISNQLNDSEKVLLFNAVVKSQFNYCPLVWMFCSRTSNNMINRVHQRALRVILGDDLSDFESLLQKNNRDIRSHHKHIQSLMIEISKIKNELAPAIMDSIFERRNEPYNLRNFQEVLAEKKELCIMVLRYLVVGLHNYGLFYQKTLRKLSHSKFLRWK